MGAFFSIVIPSYLGPYAWAAKNRDQKLIRALDSVFNQTFQKFEIVFVADGCEESYDIVTRNYSDPRLVAFEIPKQQYLSGTPRNFGISKASGKYVVYLDIDDVWGENHLKIIHDGIKKKKPEKKWVFFDDWLGNLAGEFRRRHCDPTKLHQCGTSNIAHARDLNVSWDSGYLHDWNFIQQLLRFDYDKIDSAEYFVCHVPRELDI